MGFDWELIEREFVQGIQDENEEKKFLDLGPLAKRHGCSYSTIRKRSGNGNWLDKRHKFKKRWYEKKENLKANTLAVESVEIDNAFIKRSKDMIDVIASQFTDERSANELKNLSVAFKNVQGVVKTAMGEPSNIEKNTVETKEQVNMRIAPDQKDELKNYFEKALQDEAELKLEAEELDQDDEDGSSS